VALATGALCGSGAAGTATPVCWMPPQAAPASSPAGAVSQGSPVAQEARATWDSGQRSAALAQMEEQLAQHPDDLDTRRQVALWQLLLHRPTAALLTTDAQPEPLADLRGRALYALGRYEEALPWLDPTDQGLALARLDALEVLGRDQELADLLTVVESRLGADHAHLLSLRGRLQMRQGHHAEAVPLFERALARDPLDLAACFGLGQSLVRTGQREAGLAQLARHRQLVPLVDALDFAQRGVDLAPQHAPSLAQLSDAERALGLIERAREHAQQAFDLAGPDELVAVTLRLARLQEEDLGAPDLALATLDAGQARQADVRLLVRAGDVLLRAGRPREALKRFETALAQRPEDDALRQRCEAARAAESPP